MCVHHSLRNHFSPDKILRDVQDLGRWRTVWDEKAVWDGAEARGLTVPLRAMLGISDGFVGEAEMGPGAAADLMALFRMQLREGQLERELLYLVRPGEMLQLLRGIFFGGRRHMEIARRMDASLAGAPMGLWKRLAVIGRALLWLRPRQVGGLLALARAKASLSQRTRR